MLLGSVCTRACRFCAVATGLPAAGPDPGRARARGARRRRTRALARGAHLGEPRRSAGRRRVAVRGHHPRDPREAARGDRRGADARFPGRSRRRGEGLRGRSRGLQPQRRDGAASLPPRAPGRLDRPLARRARAREAAAAGGGREVRLHGRARRELRRRRSSLLGAAARDGRRLRHDRAVPAAVARSTCRSSATGSPRSSTRSRAKAARWASRRWRAVRSSGPRITPSPAFGRSAGPPSGSRSDVHVRQDPPRFRQAEPAPALRAGRGDRDDEVRAARGRGHRRPRHGQPGHGDARPT